MFERLYKAGRLKMLRRRPGPRIMGRDAGGHDASAGLPAYEVSNHARPGGERPPQPRSIGATANMPASVPARTAACSRREGGLAQSTERHPEMWLTVVETEGHGLDRERPACRRASRVTNFC